MKRIVALMLTAVLVLSLASCKKYPYQAEYTELGIPLKDYYTTGGVERCVWDLEVLGNKLYVGSGDYDKNKGPVMMWHYDFEEQTWNLDTGLPDEQIERFFVFGNKLYAAGCDPQSSWSYGNFYFCEDTRWQTNNTIPGGIHNFDLIKFDGKLFAGIGVVEGDAPVAYTEDEKNWTPVYLYKDGKLRETYGAEFIRVYDFFTLNNTLYAYFYTYYGEKSYMEIYRFEDDKFVYHSDMLSNMKYSKSTYGAIAQKTEFLGKQYIATGLLYKTEDMKTAEQIDLGEKVRVNDIRVIKDTLYLLCNERILAEDGTEQFRVSVKRTTDGETFEEMFYFSYPVRALSFTYSEKYFYFGMGYGIKAEKEYNENGMVLSVKNPVK